MKRGGQAADIGVLIAIGERVKVRGWRAVMTIRLERVARDAGVCVGDVRDVGLVVAREYAAGDEDADRGQRDRDARASAGLRSTDHALISARPGQTVNSALW